MAVVAVYTCRCEKVRDSKGGGGGGGDKTYKTPPPGYRVEGHIA